MSLLLFGSIAFFFYCVSVIAQSLCAIRNQTSLTPLAHTAGTIALSCHSYTAYQMIDTGAGLNLGFFSMLSLMGLIASWLFFAINMKKPLDNLLLVIYPIAAASLLLALFFSQDGTYNPKNHLGPVFYHVIVSILAYCMLTLAACQALLLAVQDRYLKRKRNVRLIRSLPPLQTMENLLFQFIAVGMILLSAAIATGFFFLQDLFAQHQAHKTILTIASWLVFATLLWGRHQMGWRGAVAIKWTLTGFCILVLAFFGTQLVLELVLQRT